MSGFKLSEAAKRLSQSDALRDLLALSAQAQQRGDADAIFFGGGLPGNENYIPPSGAVARDMAEVSQRIFSDPARAIYSLQYTGAQGYGPLRQVMVDEYKDRWGKVIDLDQVQITVGSQGGISLSMLLTTDQGDVVLQDNPGYAGNIAAAKVFPIQLWGVRSDDQGPVPGAVCEALSTAQDEGRRVSLLLVAGKGNPDTSRKLTKERITDLAEIALEYRFAIADDRAYDLLCIEDEAPPITVIAPDIGFHLRTFSKPGGPGFRTGWMIGPVDVMKSAAQGVFGLHLAPPGPTQTMAAEYILSGKMNENLAFIREQYAESRRVMMEALDSKASDEIEYRVPHEGTMFINGRNTLGVDTMKAAPSIAEKQNVFFLPQGACTAERVIGGTEEDMAWKIGGMRLNHTNPSIDRIPEGVCRLRDGLKEAARDKHTSYPIVSSRPW